MLDLEIAPERSLGCNDWEFRLGMHFSQAVSIIQSCGERIRDVQCIYSNQHPLDIDLILNLPRDGFRLIFDPVVQRLKTIEIYDMQLIKLKYGNTSFNTPLMEATLDRIEQTFGATHPGVYDAINEVFTLNFRGLAFFFPAPKSKVIEESIHPGQKLVTIPGNTEVSITVLYSGGSDISEAILPEMAASCYHGLYYLDALEVLRVGCVTYGVRLKVHTAIAEDGYALSLMQNDCRYDDFEIKGAEREIHFGYSCQDVFSAIGSPSRIYYKSEDKMRIHSPNVNQRTAKKYSGDYFLNYFTLGLDILIDSRTNCVKKFILHTNFAGHYNFNMYHRCEFHLTLHADRVPGDQQRAAAAAAPASAALDADTQTPAYNQLPLVYITPYTKWNELTQLIAHDAVPVIMNRSQALVHNSTNPFGSTYMYGYQDLVFEVMPNNHIASLTLFHNVNVMRPPITVTTVAVSES